MFQVPMMNHRSRQKCMQKKSSFAIDTLRNQPEHTKTGALLNNALQCGLLYSHEITLKYLVALGTVST